MKQATRAIPEGFHSITPHLVCEGAARALDFYRDCFGAVEVSRMPGPDGRIMHAELRIGDSMVMLADDFPDYGSPGPIALKGSPVVMHLYVRDADAVWERAMAAGAKPLMPLGDAFWGDRYGQFLDPFGHRWAVATHQRDMTPDEIQEAMAKEMPPECGGGA
ncbi:VOC family protein [Massilia sp. G4R7]|uniref:VOC family protein n=1 Tax=Massilia phyllostachyos TaxID=2898585 RepID=A0ABS8QA27_9BURK|nr:VOC family protein [Massilia phyllostachyos]MCD2518599.1 VOC family protein [Massilia phyllostachyos]